MRVIVAPRRSQTQHLESTWATSRSQTNTWINEGTPTELSPTWRIFPKSPLEGNSPAILYPLCRDLEENVNATFVFFSANFQLQRVKTLIYKHLREWDAWALNPASEPGCLVICFIIGNGTAVFSFLLSRNWTFNQEHKGNFPCHAGSIYWCQRIISAILTFVSLTWPWAKCTLHNFVLCKEPWTQGPVFMAFNPCHI